MSYDELRRLAQDWDNTQRARIAMGNVAKAAERTGKPHGAVVEATRIFEAHEKYLKTVIRRTVRKTEEPWLQRVREFVETTPGIGEAVYAIVGLLPPLTAFGNPGKLWKYCGLHVHHGRAPRRPTCGPACKKLCGECEHDRWSFRLKSYTIMKLVDPVIKLSSCEYRHLYDARKEHARATHPEWSENPKAPAMHYHRDAMRYVAKRILLDLWRAANGLNKDDTLRRPAVPSALPDSVPLSGSEAGEGLTTPVTH